MRAGTCAILVAAAVLAGCTPSPGSHDISAEALLERPADGHTLILDVRSAEEFAGGHVPGAINIPHDQVAARLSQLEPHRGGDIVVYCESGRRAGKATEVLEGAGYPNLLHLEGDMSGWRAAGHPIAR